MVEVVAMSRVGRKIEPTSIQAYRPYMLQWLNECGEMNVKKPVKVLFSIGKYRDKVLCDIVPMKACHLLLGRPWQYDRCVTHNRFLNHYSFIH